MCPLHFRSDNKIWHGDYFISVILDWKLYSLRYSDEPTGKDNARSQEMRLGGPVVGKGIPEGSKARRKLWSEKHLENTSLDKKQE